MLQVAYEFEFTRYRFDCILQKPGLNRNSKKPIPAMLSINYKDSTTAENPPLSINGRRALSQFYSLNFRRKSNLYPLGSPEDKSLAK